MTKYIGMVAAAALAIGCGGEKAPEVPEVTAMAVSVTDPALEKIREDYVTHYNMHHASVVGDLFADSAVMLAADGSIDLGKAAIIAGMEQTMGASPTLDITTQETTILGSEALTRGRYQISMTPPGAAQVSLSGHYMTHFERVGDAWKIKLVVTNYDAPPPAGLPAPRGADTQPPPENGTLTDLYKAYTEHFNLGHAGAVAELYTEDAVRMLGNQAPSEGRAAIEAGIAQSLTQGSPQLTLHPVATIRPTDGWAIDEGWYEVKATTADGPATTMGAYMLLVRRMEDGSWKIHRSITNTMPAPTS